MGWAPSCSTGVWRKGPWSPDEDALLINYIEANGMRNYCWRSIPRLAGLMRSGKSCRLRWINYLRPDVKRGSISPEEEDLILRLHRLIGNRWALIAGRLPGRTDNEIKNYWKCHLRKKVEKSGTINLQSKKRRMEPHDAVPNKHPVARFTTPPNSTKELAGNHFLPSSPRHEMRAKNDYSSNGKRKTSDGYVPKHLGEDSSSKSFCQHVERRTDLNTDPEARNHSANIAVPYYTVSTESDYRLVSLNSNFPSSFMDGDIDAEHCFQLLEAAVISSPSSYSNSEMSSSGRSTARASSLSMEPSNQKPEKTSDSTIPSISASETFSLIEQNEELHHSFENEMLADTQVSETVVTPYGRGYRNISDCGSVKQLGNGDRVLVSQHYTDAGLDLSGSSSDLQKTFDSLYAFDDFQTRVDDSRPSHAMNSDQRASHMDFQEDFLYFKNICPDTFAYCF